MGMAVRRDFQEIHGAGMLCVEGSGPLMEPVREITGPNAQQRMLQKNAEGTMPDKRSHEIRMPMGSGLKHMQIEPARAGYEKQAEQNQYLSFAGPLSQMGRDRLLDCILFREALLRITRRILFRRAAVN